jgi:hypothetical protein
MAQEYACCAKKRFVTRVLWYKGKFCTILVDFYATQHDYGVNGKKFFERSAIHYRLRGFLLLTTPVRQREPGWESTHARGGSAGENDQEKSPFPAGLCRTTGFF